VLVCRARAINLRTGSQINDTTPKAAGRTPVGESSSRRETCTMQCLSCALVSTSIFNKKRQIYGRAELQFKLEAQVAKRIRMRVNPRKPDDGPQNCTD